MRTSARWGLGKLGRHYRTDSVTAMLDTLGWRSLQQRRADSRLCMLYKIQNGLVRISNPALRLVSGISQSVNPHKLIELRKYNADQFNSFYPRTVHQWNNLSPDVASAPSLNTFKHRVSQVHHRAK